MVIHAQKLCCVRRIGRDYSAFHTGNCTLPQDLKGCQIGKPLSRKGERRRAVCHLSTATVSLKSVASNHIKPVALTLVSSEAVLVPNPSFSVIDHVPCYQRASLYTIIRYNWL